MFRYRRHHPALLFGALVLALLILTAVADLLAHAWLLLTLGLGVLAVFTLTRRIDSSIRHSIRLLTPPAGPEAEAARLRADLSQATAELSRVRAQVDALEDAAARPIGAITATYRRRQP